MNQPKIYDEGSNFYRTPRSLPHGSMWMRRFDVKPRQDVPESPGCIWFVVGAVCGAAVLALVLA